jgi:hypothetical protein
MNRFMKFYHTVFGRVLVHALIGAAVGYLIYWWRGNVIAPIFCSVASAFMGYAGRKK